MDIKEKYQVCGMTCTNCVNHIEKAVRKVDGVKDVNINLFTNTMILTKDKSTPISDILNAVKDAGYSAKIKNSIDDTKTNNNDDLDLQETETKKLFSNLIISLFLIIPLFYISMGYMLDWNIGYLKTNPLMLGLLEFLLSLSIMIIHRRFYILGFKSIFKLSPTMDSLVAIGSGISFIYSTIILIVISYFEHEMKFDMANMYAMNLCFETAGMVPTFIAIGKTLESYSKGKTTSAIKSLIALEPKIIHILENNKVIDKNVEEANIGDIFVVKPGETIPIDGIIISGVTSIDEKALTGESIPLDKKENDSIYCGTINIQGVITCKVLKKSGETILNQIVEMVKNASSTKTKTSALVDKVSFYFIPTIIIISFIVFISWLIFGNNYITYQNNHYTNLTYAIEKGVSILVISCPCALGLATPVSIMVGSGVGAKNGILFKTAGSMEECGLCKFVVLDKTGTITLGEPFVEDIIPLNNTKQDELIKIAYSLEQNSEHPLAKAINNFAIENKYKPYNVNNTQALIGKGIKADINNQTYYAGNILLLDELKINYSKEKDIITSLQDKGKQILIFFNKKHIIGIITLVDKIKEDSIKAIDNFKKQGLIPIILSGDNKIIVSQIASKVSIDYYYGNLLPQDKQSIIKVLQRYGKVLYIGDGINDALSLEQANVSMALNSGSDIALDSGNIVLTNSSLLTANYAINLSRIVRRNIRENLFWAFIYNIIMIPIAAGVFSSIGLAKLKPWMGSVAMSLSSIFVCLNALSINIRDIKKNNYKSKRIEGIENIINEIKNIDNSNNNASYFYVPDMMCENCIKHISNVLSSFDKISNVNISLDTKKVTFINHGEDLNNIKQAIINNGYKYNKEL